MTSTQPVIIRGVRCLSGYDADIVEDLTTDEISERDLKWWGVDIYNDGSLFVEHDGDQGGVFFAHRSKISALHDAIEHARDHALECDQEGDPLDPRVPPEFSVQIVVDDEGTTYYAARFYAEFGRRGDASDAALAWAEDESVFDQFDQFADLVACDQRGSS